MEKEITTQLTPEILEEIENVMMSAKISSLRGGSAHIRFRELCFTHIPTLLATARRVQEATEHLATAEVICHQYQRDLDRSRIEANKLRTQLSQSKHSQELMLGIEQKQVARIEELEGQLAKMEAFYANACLQVTDSKNDLSVAQAEIEKRNWRTMESAPEDGTVVFLLNHKNDVDRGFYEKQVDDWVVEENGEPIFPVRWQPLPTAPEQKD